MSSVPTVVVDVPRELVEKVYEVLGACGLIASPMGETFETAPADVQAKVTNFAGILLEVVGGPGAAAPGITDQAIAAEPLLQLFRWSHLPAHLQERSAPFGRLAVWLAETAPRNPERTTALRKLREAKDAAVTAHVWIPAEHVLPRAVEVTK